MNRQSDIIFEHERTRKFATDAGPYSDTHSKRLLLSLCLAIVCVSILSIAILQQSTSAEAGPVLAWLVNLTVTTFVGIASWNEAITAAREFRAPRRMGSVVLSPLLLMSVTLPSISLVWRTRVANVEKLTGTELATPEALTFCLLLFAACLFSFWVGEGLLKPWWRNAANHKSASTQKWNRAHLVLMTVGLCAAVTRVGGDRTLEFAERGTQVGQGVLVLLWWCLPLGVAVGLLFNHWGSKWRWVLSLAGIALIVNSGVRSPLILIALALVPLVIRKLARSDRPLRVWGVSAAGAYLLIAVGGAISSWRGSIRYGRPISFGQSLVDALSDPLKALTTSGLDTVDGLLFVHSLPPNFVDTSLLDLLKVFQTAIPTQLYPDKPEFISNIISRDLLGYGTAGMFMSGPGYLILIGGGWLAAVGLFCLGGVCYRQLTGSAFGGCGWLICTYTLVRFVMGGDAFDFYQGMTLIALASAALLVATLFELIGDEKRLPRIISPDPAKSGRHHD